MNTVEDPDRLKAHIVAHPHAAVGIAFAAGLLLGGRGRRSKSSRDQSAAVKSSVLGAAMATLGSVVFALAKNLMLHQLSGSAKTWWDQRIESAH